MVLVTGASGLVGSHLLYFLAKKDKKVKAMVRSLPDGKSTQNIKKVFAYYNQNEADDLFSKIEFIEGDVNDYLSIEDSLKGVSQVYHCAALVSFNYKDASLLQKINYEGTANIVNACLETNIRLCFVSSVATLGESKTNDEITETDFWQGAFNKSAYSISKFNAEREVWRGFEEGLNGFIINPSLIIGAGNWGKSSSNMLISASKGMRFKTPGLTGFVDVRDVANIAIDLMESTCNKERFIINSGNFLFSEFYTIAANIFKKQTPSINLPKAVANIGVVILKVAAWFGFQTQLSKATVNVAYEKKMFSNKKIKSFLNYNFISFKDSVEFASKAYVLELNKN